MWMHHTLKCHGGIRRYASAILLAYVGGAAMAQEAATTKADHPPRDAHVLLTRADRLSSDELGALAQLLAADEYLVIPHEAGPIELVFGDSELFALGKRLGQLASGHGPIEPGVYVNLSGEPVFIRFSGTSQAVELGSGGLLSFGDLSDAPVDARARECQVTCRDGYHACCSYGSGESPRPICRCLRTQAVPGATCDSGGEGAATCRINESGTASIDLE